MKREVAGTSRIEGAEFTERELDAALREILLGAESIEWQELMRQLTPTYKHLKNPIKAMVRDVNNLSSLGAISVEEFGERQFRLKVRLEWPTEIRKLPKAKSPSFLQ